METKSQTAFSPKISASWHGARQPETAEGKAFELKKGFSVSNSDNNPSPVELDASGIFEALSGEDNLGVVVRGLIHMEYELDKFIAKMIFKPDELKLNNFGMRLRVALACGLRTELKKPLQILSKIRNNFAHELSIELTETHVEDLRKSFSRLELTILKDVCSKQIGGTNANSYESFGTSDRLRLLLIVLWCAIVTESRKLEQ